MDLLNLYGHFSLLTIAASLLAILALRITTGSTSQQMKLVRKFRTSVERASRNCMRARSTALARKFDAQDAKVLLFTTERPRRFYVEEADRLIRTLVSVTKDSRDMRVGHLRRCLKETNRIERESLRLLSSLSVGRH
jgi:chromosome condensin MukBEF MukE localization factor